MTEAGSDTHKTKRLFIEPMRTLRALAQVGVFFVIIAKVQLAR